MKIGVLALQGNFREHLAMLDRLGVEGVEVRLPEQLDGLAGLIVPGGESTAIGRLARLCGLDEAIEQFPAPIFGTCAGMILLAADVLDGTPDQRCFGLLDVDRAPQRLRPPGRSASRPTSRRRDQAARSAPCSSGPRESNAPAPTSRCSPTSTECRCSCAQGRVLAAAFHPELTDDTRLHELFSE